MGLELEEVLSCGGLQWRRRRYWLWNNIIISCDV